MNPPLLLHRVLAVIRERISESVGRSPGSLSRVLRTLLREPGLRPGQPRSRVGCSRWRLLRSGPLSQRPRGVEAAERQLTCHEACAEWVSHASKRIKTHETKPGWPSTEIYRLRCRYGYPDPADGRDCGSTVVSRTFRARGQNTLVPSLNLGKNAKRLAGGTAPDLHLLYAPTICLFNTALSSGALCSSPAHLCHHLMCWRFPPCLVF